MERLFGPASPQFSASVWLYDIDHDWINPMFTIHPIRPEAVPLYYTPLCGFHGLVGHLITAHSQNVNSRGGCHTTRYMPPQLMNIQTSHPYSSDMVQILTLLTT